MGWWIVNLRPLVQLYTGSRHIISYRPYKTIGGRRLKQRLNLHYGFLQLWDRRSVEHKRLHGASRRPNQPRSFEPSDCSKHSRPSPASCAFLLVAESAESNSVSVSDNDLGACRWVGRWHSVLNSTLQRDILLAVERVCLQDHVAKWQYSIHSHWHLYSNQ